MSVSLSPSKLAIAPGSKKPFYVSGGVAPYTYSVVYNGVGGTIDSAGLYTAPIGSYGTDIVKVEDSTGDIAEVEVKVLSALELLCDVIQTEMGLADGRVYLWDQKIPEPTDFGLFVIAQTVNCKPFGNSFYPYSTVTGMESVQSTNFYASVQIDIISRSIDAMNRKEELIMALKSQYCEQQQDLNSFHIASLPTNFVNLSGIDGGAIPYRFSITIGLQYQVKKVSSISYYDSFLSPSVITNP